MKLTERLRKLNYNVDFDMTNKKFTKQLEKASKSAKFAIILGEDELSAGVVKVKDLKSGEETQCAFADIQKIFE